MGLLTIIRKQRLKEKELRVLILGLDNGGKTTILKKLNGEDIYEVSPTLGKFIVACFLILVSFFREYKSSYGAPFLVWIVPMSIVVKAIHHRPHRNRCVHRTPPEFRFY